jgi:hypothetical protein
VVAKYLILAYIKVQNQHESNGMKERKWTLLGLEREQFLIGWIMLRKNMNNRINIDSKHSFKPQKG